MNRITTSFNLLLKIYLVIVISLITLSSNAQTGTISGKVMLEGEPIEYAQISLTNTLMGAVSDEKGNFIIENVAYGSYEINASYVGYKKEIQNISLGKNQPKITVDFNINTKSNDLDELVVTGSRTSKRQTDVAVIVDVVSSETLDNVQACNLAEGLKFQPGLRVETDCQTCNYTQLRINGLAGGYSQILINGRPIFSPLTGLYGLEQIPKNMIDRIEVVRGGGSSLYGSSAIGGTVNVITKIPNENGFELDYTYQNINGKTSDHILNGNATLVTEKKNAGLSFFSNYRNRNFYDDNGDNFSEIPLVENIAFGTNIFFLPADNQKLEFNISHINEYRFGGEMSGEPAFLTEQSEERTHRVWMGSADYQVNFNDNNSSAITYFAWQNTNRDHYTGILPDEEEDIANHLENPPYGVSQSGTYQVGLQLNHRLKKFLGGENTLTFGGEYIHDKVFDEIIAYNYLIDQTTRNLGVFLQSDWTIIPSLTLLSGVRLDIHNLLDKPLISPRVALLYRLKSETQFRLNVATGFRAPQAFDTDLHIAFAGGGVSRVILSPDLEPERSLSVSASINYDKPMKRFILGFTVDAFYTRLNKAFFLEPIGEDAFGEVFEKQNGQGATVKGATIEFRGNYNKKVQLETGFTFQSSRFDEAVEYIENFESERDFIRTPNTYGSAILTIMPIERINASISYIYTGKMIVPHFAGASNQLVDEMFISNAFSEVNIRFSYSLPIPKLKSTVDFYGGVKNIFNAFQSEFDIGKNRDSNFVYGPSLPRTFFVGLKLRV